VSTTLWDTTGAEIVAALAQERRQAGAFSPGQALTLVVVAAERQVASVERAASFAAQSHPCRLLVVVRNRVDAADRLDAEVAVAGRFGPIEAVVMRMDGRLSLHAESVVLPLLAPDAPVFTWWNGAPPDEIATDPLGVLAGRRITDCALSSDPLASLRQRAIDYARGDTDLAWARTTPWRSLVASAYDGMAPTPISARVSGERLDPSGPLLAGWLSARLGFDVPYLADGGPGVTSVEVESFTSGGDRCTLRIDRPDGRVATLSRSGEADRRIPLPRRELGELLTEELRRLDPDPVYAESLERVTGIAELTSRPSARTHIWRDPMVSSA
jgi:glucose-6-phosphate dehydrogenase assembly protein OpcA